MRYAPVGPVVTDRVSPVSLLVAVTVAPVTTAPELSVTPPAMIPLLVCAMAGRAKTMQSRRQTTAALVRDGSITKFPPAIQVV
jgi:hypothetical protein